MFSEMYTLYDLLYSSGVRGLPIYDDYEPKEYPLCYIFDDDGDLWLHVGNGLGKDEPKCHFKVCASAMRRASSVWKAMLFGPWAEAKPAVGEWSVEMPEDKSAALAILLAIVHGRLELIPNSVLSDCDNYGIISNILIAADKYHLTHVLSTWAPTWVGFASSPWLHDLLETMQRLHIAWELGSGDQLAVTTKFLIFEYPDDQLQELLDFAEQCPSLGFPYDLADILSVVPEGRQFVIQKILDMFHQGVRHHVQKAHRGRKAAQTGISTADLLAQSPGVTFGITDLWEELRYRRNASQIGGSAKGFLWKLQSALFLFGKAGRVVTGRRKRASSSRELFNLLQPELISDWSDTSNILQGKHLEHLEKRRELLKTQFCYW